MSTYSLRSAAKDFHLPLATVADLAKKHNVGAPGPYPNSPRRLDDQAYHRLGELALGELRKIYADKKGQHENAIFAAHQQMLHEARSMGRLASLAAVQGHPATAALRRLNAIVQEIDSAAGIGARAVKIDPKDVGKRVAFCSAWNGREERLRAALADASKLI